MIQSGYTHYENTSIFIGDRGRKTGSAASSRGSLKNDIKKFGMNFDPLFKDRKLVIYENYINKFCVKYNSTFNGEMIMSYVLECVKLSLVKVLIWVFRSATITRIFYIQ
jgi:hypothetical protein